MSEKKRTTKPVYQVFIVDDHPLVRRGLQALIEPEKDLQACGEAATESEALEGILAVEPDLAVVDLMLKEGSGLELLRQIRERLPKTRSVVFSMHSDSSHVQMAIRLGARAYVLKEEGTAKIIDAIRAVLRGDLFLSHGAAAVWKPRKADRQEGFQPHDVLTHREVQVLEMFGHGLKTDEVAGCFGISVATVESHRERIKQKLGLRHASALAHYAYNWVHPATNNQGIFHSGGPG